MATSLTYILTSVVIFLIIVILLIFLKKNRKQKPLTPLTGLAFGFILAGIIFGDNRIIGYGLMGIGVLLAVIDMIIKLKRKS